MQINQDADLQLSEFLQKSEGRELSSLSEEEIIELVVKFAIWPNTNSYVKAPWVARYAVRRQRHRKDERVRGEKRDLWGMPDERGYFADDNSLLKSTFKNMQITGRQNPYVTSKLSTGLVCCHIWAATTSDPLLFSFLPNLVWLPKRLAKYTDVYKDRSTHSVHYVMQELSHRRYGGLKVNVGIDQAEMAWSKLSRPSIDLPDLIEFTEMESEPSLSLRVKNRHLRLNTVIEAAISETTVSHKRFSRRYHLGVGSFIDNSIPPLNKLVSRAHLLELKRIVDETTPL